MVLNSPRVVSLKHRDIDLERLYGILFVYFDLYSNYNYNFKIIRRKHHYELFFKGERECRGKGGAFCFNCCLVITCRVCFVSSPGGIYG